MDESMIDIGKRILNRRKELNLTQNDIYVQCGITSGALSKIENGSRTPTILVFHKIAQALQCDVEWLLTGVASERVAQPLSANEKNLLAVVRELPEDDQEELTEIARLKLDRLNRKRERDSASKSMYINALLEPFRR